MPGWGRLWAALCSQGFRAVESDELLGVEDAAAAAEVSQCQHHGELLSAH